MSNNFFSKEEEEVYSPPQNLNLLPFIRIIKRKAWLIAFITAIVAIPYTYLNWKKNSVSQYAGSFQLLVEPLTVEAKLSEPTTITSYRGVPNDRVTAINYPTLIKILTSQDILSEIAEQVKTKYANFNTRMLYQNLQVQRIGTSRIDESKIIAITYQGVDPNLVQLVLDATAQKYLDYSLSSRVQEVSAGLDFIEQQLPQLDRKVAVNLNEIQKLQEQYQMIAADIKGESLLATIRGIKQQQIEIDQTIEEQTRTKENLQSKLNINVDEAIAISTLRENPNYQNLIKQFKDKERELAVVSATFNSNSPQVIHLQEEKQELSNLLQTETRRIILEEGLSINPGKFLVTNNENSILMSLVQQLIEAANQLEALQARQQALSKNLIDLEQQAQEFPEVSRRYKELQQDLDIANRTREQLLIQKDKLTVQASQNQAPWTIIDQPQVVSDSAGNPIPVPVDSGNEIVKGLLAGLLLGLGTAILVERSRDKFFTTEDISDVTKSSIILGEIPFNHNLHQTHQQKPLVKSWFDLPTDYPSNIGQVDDAHFDFLNGFYKLYANICLRYRESSIHSLTVCSATKREGKSTIALYLARQIAATGKRVLLVDTNSFNYQFTDKLISITQAEKNLFVLFASQKILDNSAYRSKLMQKFQEAYDHVIYDTPPLLDSVTAGFLSVETSGILLVTDLDKTNKSSFIKAFEQIEKFNLPLLGIVVNHTGSEKLPIDQVTSIEPNQLVVPEVNSNLLESEVNYQSLEENNSVGNQAKSIKSSKNN